MAGRGFILYSRILWALEVPVLVPERVASPSPALAPYPFPPLLSGSSVRAGDRALEAGLELPECLSFGGSLFRDQLLWWCLESLVVVVPIVELGCVRTSWLVEV